MQVPGTNLGKVEEFEILLREAFFNNEEALRFILDVFAAAHVWDDLVDGDAVTQAQFQRTFRDLFLEIPTNPFYIKHFTALHPIILNSMLNWEAANKMEMEKRKNDLQIAYILRSSFIDLVGVTAFLLGGYEHAVQVVLKMRRIEHSESLEEYKETV